MRPEYMLERYYPKEKQEKDKEMLDQMKKAPRIDSDRQ
jgi:hypothetical protein